MGTPRDAGGHGGGSRGCSGTRMGIPGIPEDMGGDPGDAVGYGWGSQGCWGTRVAIPGMLGATGGGPGNARGHGEGPAVPVQAPGRCRPGAGRAGTKRGRGGTGSGGSDRRRPRERRLRGAAAAGPPGERGRCWNPSTIHEKRFFSKNLPPPFESGHVPGASLRRLWGK